MKEKSNFHIEYWNSTDEKIKILTKIRTKILNNWLKSQRKQFADSRKKMKQTSKYFFSINFLYKKKILKISCYKIKQKNLMQQCFHFAV